MEINASTTVVRAADLPPRSAKRIAKAEKAKAKSASRERIPLKKICSSMKIDPKLARRKLRAAKLGFHDLGNRWELTPKQAAKVRETLRA